MSTIEDLKARSDVWFNHDQFQWCLTSHGGVIVVIQRDDDPTEIDGDGLAPIGYLDYRYEWSGQRSGDTFEDPSPSTSDIIAVHAHALNAYGRGDVRVERYLAAFHGTTILEVENPHDSGFWTVYNTPAYREHVGATDATTALIVGERDEVIAHRDGDVWGVGYGVYTGEDDVEGAEPRGDDFLLFDITIECWGFCGEKYARDTAAAFEYGKPAELPVPTNQEV